MKDFDSLNIPEILVISAVPRKISFQCCLPYEYIKRLEAKEVL